MFFLCTKYGHTKRGDKKKKKRVYLPFGMSNSGEDFQVVTRKKWMARKCLRRRDRHKSESDYLIDCPDVNVEKFQP